MTILGKHTLTETRDLVHVVDYRFNQTAKAVDSMKADNLPANIDERSALLTDWEHIRDKWKTERADIAKRLLVKSAAMGATLPASLIPTEDEWQRTLAFVQGQELVKGSFQDIVNRIQKVTGKRIDFSKDPKQNAVDADLIVFKEVDEKIKAGEEAAKVAKETAGEAAKSNTGLLIIGGVVLGVAGVIAIKRL